MDGKLLNVSPGMFIDPDRRRSRRYNLSLELQYMTLDGGMPAQVGAGWSCNMSTSGLLFRTSNPLPKECSLVAALRWPASLRRDSPLLLLVIGRLIRSAGGETAISVSHHEFVCCESYEKFRIESVISEKLEARARHRAVLALRS